MTDAMAPTEHASGDETAASLAPRVRSPSLQPGTHVGRYELTAKLGAGGMGVVYRARDPKLARDVAVKLVAMNGLADAQARLEREAQAMAKLSHPNVCTVHDIGAWNGQLFVAMELCTGGTLTAWLRERHTWREIVGTLVAAGRGLAAAHALGIVHRDFKPDNVMRTGDGLVKVTDFGLARSSREAGDIEGTPAYMAPEQLSGGEVDARGDQFAFAVTAWQALCGALPFQPDPAGVDVFDRMLRAIRSRRRVRATDAFDVPTRVVAIVARGLEPEPKDRWPSLDAMLDALERAARPRARYYIAGAVVLALAGAIGIGAWVTAPDPAPLFPPGPSPGLARLYFQVAEHDVDVDKRVPILMKAFNRSGDKRYLLEAATLQVEWEAAGNLENCNGLELLDAYTRLSSDPLPAHLADAAARVRVICRDKPLYQMMKDPQEIEDYIDQAERSGEFKGAIDALRRLIEMRHGDIALIKRLGDLYIDEGACDAAEAEYNRFLAAAPDADRWRDAIKKAVEACPPK